METPIEILINNFEMLIEIVDTLNGVFKTPTEILIEADSEVGKCAAISSISSATS